MVKNPARVALFTGYDEGQEHHQNSPIRIEYYPLIEFVRVKEYEESLLKRWRELLEGNVGYFLFTSKRAVKFFADIVICSDMTPNRYNKKFSRVITVGPTTLSALEIFLGKYGFRADYRADKEGRGKGQRGVWKIIHSQCLNPIIHVCPVYVDGFLEKKLVKHGYIYERYPIYETLLKKIDNGIKEKVFKCDYLLFTSNSIVKSFWNNFKDFLESCLEKNMSIPPALFISESSQKNFQEMKKKINHPRVENWKSTLLCPGRDLTERVIKTMNPRHPQQSDYT